MSRLAFMKKGSPGRIFPYEAEVLELKLGDICILESEREIEHGRVVSIAPVGHDKDKLDPVGKVLRKASEEDLKQIEINIKDAMDAFEACQHKIKEKGLPMKLVSGEYSFDRSRLFFAFTAEGRVDFRELVRDLAKIFKTRIEFRQIGVRDEAKIKGGIGPCGYKLCCASFLADFEPINIRTAKQQRLSLDPDKISGICGRLLCCLKYEDQFYRHSARIFPRDGSVVRTPEGEGKVVDLNFIRRTVVVEMEDERRLEFPIEKIKNSGRG